MGVEYLYLTKSSFSIEELLSFHEVARRKIPDLSDLSGKGLNHAYFNPTILPDFSIFKGIRLRKIGTDGYLPLDDNSMNIFKGILRKSANTIGDIGLLLTGCGFEEKNSKQNKRAYDNVRIKIERGKKFFCYSSNGSKVSVNHDYKKDFMHRIIEIVKLPMRIEEGNGYFKLLHSKSGEIRITTGGFGGKNPSGFNCEMPDLSTDELVDRMRIFLENFATAKRFDYSWSTGTGGRSNEEGSKQIFAMTLKANFPAEYYFLDIEFTPEDISGIEVLQSLCGPKDEIYTSFLYFDLPENNRAEMDIETTAKGHRLMLTLTDNSYLAEIQEKLGLEFKKVN